MTEETKKSIIDVAKIIGGVGSVIALILLIPDGSLGQKILAWVMGIALVVGIIWFNGLGNPIKKLYRKITGKKQGE